MSPARRARQIALAVFVLAAVASLAIWLTGGFVWHWGAVRISARHVRSPALAALLAAAAAWTLSTPEERRRTLPAAIAWIRAERGPARVFRDSPERLGQLITVSACIAVVLLGLLKGTFVAGGADSYGYVSQADLWARGRLIVEQPYSRDMTWPNAAATLVPLGYTLRAYFVPGSPGSSDADLVPVYAPGLPMLMALGKLLVGSKGVFLVVPLLGGLAVWATYVMGRRVAGRVVGAGAAVLLAASPSFLFEVTSPTSDVPAAAWWASALALLLVDRGIAAFGAGVAVGMAVLTRPNLAPLVVLPGLLLLGGARRRLFLFGAGVLPGFLTVASVNTYLYGSPFASGYGRLSDFYSREFFAVNVVRYSRWLLETQTPLVILAALAPLVVRSMRGDVKRPSLRATVTMWWCLALAVFGSYVFYLPGNDWPYLRFLLPAYPSLAVMTVASLTALLAPLRRIRHWTPALVTGAVVALVAWSGVMIVIEGRVLHFWRDEHRYVAAGHYVGDRLPLGAAILSSQHSGSVRYYSGRLTVRFDLIPPAALDTVVNELQRLGYPPYLLLDEGEEADFRKRFHGQSALAALDWWPVAMIQGRLVRIYDLAEGQARRVASP